MELQRRCILINLKIHESCELILIFLEDIKIESGLLANSEIWTLVHEYIEWDSDPEDMDDAEAPPVIHQILKPDYPYFGDFKVILSLILLFLLSIIWTSKR